MTHPPETQSARSQTEEPSAHCVHEGGGAGQSLGKAQTAQPVPVRVSQVPRTQSAYEQGAPG
jgi:hypothetical protein